MVKTKALLRDSERTLPEIYASLCMDDEFEITYFWLRKFSSGMVKDPSVNKVQILYEHLTGKTLTV